MRHLAVSDIASVEPYIKTGVHTLKVQAGPGRRCVLPVDKITHIGSARVVLRHIRRIKGKRIPDIGILMPVIALHLPYAGHFDPVIRRCVKILLIKRILQFIDAGIIPETPFSVQHLQAVRILPPLHQRIHPHRCRDIVRPGRHGVLMEHAQVFIVSWYDHILVLLITVPQLPRSRCFFLKLLHVLFSLSSLL